MKFSLIGVLALLCFNEAIAGSRGYFSSRRSKSAPRIANSRNHPENRPRTSSSVTPFNPQNSRFRPFSSPSSSSSSHPSSSSHISRLPSRSPPPSTSGSLPSVLHHSRLSSPSAHSPTQFNWHHQTSKKTKVHQSPSSLSPSRSSSPRPKPSLQQLQNPSTSSQPSTSGQHPTSPRPGHGPANPQPSTSGHTPATSGPTVSIGHGPIQPSVPPSMTPDAEALKRAREARKEQKLIEKQQKKAKKQANEEAKIQQQNANKGTCKDKSAPDHACYDFYKLALTWKSRNARIWTIHGLWPARLNQAPVPRECPLSHEFSPLGSSLTTQLNRKWFQTSTSNFPNNIELWRHEWNHHGKCAMRSPAIGSVKQYFAKGLELFRQARVGQKLADDNITPGLELSNEEMHNRFSLSLTHKVVLISSKDRVSKKLHINEIHLCYSLQFRVIDCPADPVALNDGNRNELVVFP